MSPNEDKLTPEQIDAIMKGVGDSKEDPPPAGEAQAFGDDGVADAPAEIQAQPIQPGELQKPNGGPHEPLDLDFILDIPLSVTVEVGRTSLLIQELLALGKGSVIELNKLMGEPFEVLVNNKLVARGEVVVVNDRFGIRLTDIVSQNERVNSLA
jgi:flagellar motor switch protein FliN/FliY